MTHFDFGVVFTGLAVGAELFVAVPEVLTVCAAVAHGHVTFAAVPVDFAVLVVLTAPAAVPADFKKIAALDFFNDKSHRHQILFDLGRFHQFIEFVNFIVSTIEVDDEYLFCKYRQIFLCHIQPIPGVGVRLCSYRQIFAFIGAILLIEFIVVQPLILHLNQ